MMLTVHDAGPSVTIQDLGRPGWTARGLSQGGAVDRLALFEAAALLGADPAQAVLELMGFGGSFSSDHDMRIALTGAVMQANIDGMPVAHNTSQLLRAGQRLTIGGARQGVYGYLAFAGGIQTPPIMGSRAAHLTAGIGGLVQSGDNIALRIDPDPLAGPVTLPSDDRLGGGTIRVMPGPQTDYFAPDTLARFAETAFLRSPRGNRQGARLDCDGPGFMMAGAINIASDLVLPGDLQMTGDGVPYVLLAECQTIGGYPRIGTVIPADLPKIAQAMPGAPLRFAWLDIPDADATFEPEPATLQKLRRACTAMRRDPHEVADLLSYQLISGMTRGDDLERS